MNPAQLFEDILRSGPLLEIGLYNINDGYVEVEDDNGKSLFGVGIHPNIVIASLKATVSALNGFSKRVRGSSQVAFRRS